MAEQDNAPHLHSQGFGPAESADETRQAQQTVSNDSPTDVNPNAALARTQKAMYAAHQQPRGTQYYNNMANANYTRRPVGRHNKALNIGYSDGPVDRKLITYFLGPLLQG